MGWCRPSAPEPAFRGQRAEDAALQLLQQANGLKLLQRNYRCRGGELDLVVLDGDILVIAEVRSRARTRFASAAESVDTRKQGRIIHAASLYLSQHPEHATRSVRFDVVAYDGDARPSWIRAALDAA